MLWMDLFESGMCLDVAVEDDGEFSLDAVALLTCRLSGNGTTVEIAQARSRRFGGAFGAAPFRQLNLF